MAQADCDVLISGGGPTGITLALLLAMRGVHVTVVEKEADIYPLPRAAHLDHEAIRILQEAGVADEVIATSRTTSRYDFLNADGQILLRFEGADRIAPGGWPSSNMIHQPSVEAALRRKLASYPNAKLLVSTELQSFVEDGEGVTATISTSGSEQRLRTQYLVGADGARSPVRHACGIEFEDLGFEEPWLVVDTIVKDFSRLPTANLQICNPARPTTCVLMGEGRHRWEFMILPGEDAEAIASDASVEAMLEPWDVKGAVELERRAVYTFRARIAKAWRKGRVMLAGDAAHQTPPFAGQGMCSGLRDAANLGWKMAAVVQGQADEAILDSYQPEREPNLRATINMAIMMGRTVCITDPAAAAMRDAQMLAAREAGQSPDGAIEYPPVEAGLILTGSSGAGSYFPQPLSADGARLDDALGAGVWLVSQQSMDARPCITSVSLEDPRLEAFAPPLAAWLDARQADAVLVRPDRHVYGTGDADALVQSWTAALQAAA